MASKKTFPSIDDLVKLVPDDKQPIAKKLAVELTFMAETLEVLRNTIKEGGVVEDFKQGKQQFVRESPALKSYNTTIQRYGTLYKQFADLLPKQSPDNIDSALYEFLKQN